MNKLENDKVFGMTLIIGVFIIALMAGFWVNYAFAKNTTAPSRTTERVKSAKEIPNEADFGPYMRNLQASIKKQWNPPKGNESKRVVLLFKVGRNGKIISSKVFKSSGSEEMDQAAMDALHKAEPFGKLPKSFKGKSIDVQFTFDYNVFKNRN